VHLCEHFLLSFAKSDFLLLHFFTHYTHFVISALYQHLDGAVSMALEEHHDEITAWISAAKEALGTLVQHPFTV
jgi:hypothetical protein